MENKVHRLRSGAKFFLNVFLRITQDRGLQLHIPWFVNAVNIAEGRSHREVRAHIAEGFIHRGDFLWLGVEAGLMHIAIVDAVFFPTRDAEFDFESHAHFRHALEIHAAGLYIFQKRLLG